MDIKKFNIEALIEAINDSALISITDLTGDIVYVNKLFSEISQYSEDDEKEKILDHINVVTNEIDDVTNTIKILVENNIDIINGEEK